MDKDTEDLAKAILVGAVACSGHHVQGPTASGIDAAYTKALEHMAKYALDQAEVFVCMAKERRT